MDGSINNALFKDTEQIIRLNVKASNDFTEGTITFKNFVFSSPDPSNDFTVEEFVVQVKAATTITFTMTDAGWGTLILPFAADVPEELTAYTCATAAANSELELVDTTSLQANTPYIMAGTAGTYEFTGAATNTEIKKYTVGALTGVLEEGTAPAGSYVLQKQGDKVAFFKVGEAGKTVKANRCYLSVADAGATMYRLGGTTGIQAVYADENGDVYDMLGRKVIGPLEKGVYIKNNRKFYVK